MTRESLVFRLQEEQAQKHKHLFSFFLNIVIGPRSFKLRIVEVLPKLFGEKRVRSTKFFSHK